MMAGDKETGVTLMRMEAGLDSGPICMAERTPIEPDDTAASLADRLARLGADLVARGLGAVERGALICQPQQKDGVTYAAKISGAETRVDWSRCAQVVQRQIQALSPGPGAWCEMPLGGVFERIKLLRSAPAEASGTAGMILSLDPFVVACGVGAVRLLELQRAGKKPATARDFVRGARLAEGTLLQ
jgi:methionyl-tRNA formyltransferase